MTDSLDNPGHQAVESTFDRCPVTDCPTPTECVGKGLGCLGLVLGYEEPTRG